MALTLQDATVVLHPGGDLHAQATEMRTLGPIAPVLLPEDVPAWAVASNTAAQAVLRDSHTFTKDISCWHARTSGQVPSDWALLPFVDPPRSMITVDGEDHRRMRAPLARAFTEARIRALAPSVTSLAVGLLDQLQRTAGQDPVDVKDCFAFPLPMYVIGDLLGIPADWHPELRDLFSVFFNDEAEPAAKVDTLGRLSELIGNLIAMRRNEPREDLVSALVGAPEFGGYVETELIGTIQVLIAAGHETTVNLLINALRALDAHPDQLQDLRANPALWPQAVEEVLRWDPPTANFPMRYATKDTRIQDVTIRRGDPVLISYIAMGRDPGTFGPTAHLFDIHRVGRRHSSFGHGPHVCIGAPLARLEAALALPAFYERFPKARIADAPTPTPSLIVNGYQDLRMQLT